MDKRDAFHGAKIALIAERGLLVYQRDDKDTIPYPGMWDLPGGGREGHETPVECALREVQEEFGLTLPPARVRWGRRYASSAEGRAATVFLVGTLTREECEAIRFGEEGQQWAFIGVEAFLSHPNAVPHLQQRLREYLREAAAKCGAGEISPRPAPSR